MRKRRSKKQWAIVSKKIIEYYFNNPHANSSKKIEEKFDVHEAAIRRILSKELNRRFENSLTRKYMDDNI